LQAHTKTLEQLVRNLVFADNASLVDNTERALKYCFAEASRLMGLKVSLKKTEVLYQPAPRDE
jgi:hypothetical protein